MLKRLSTLVMLFAIIFSFNSHAMDNSNYKGFVRSTPLNQSEESTYKWAWIDDETCVNYNPHKDTTPAILKKRFDNGMLARWAEGKENEETVIKQRYTYSGKWTQAQDGIWSFEFDDKTIPVGVTKIDGVLYAFNGYGELKAGYEYYTGFKTEADGLVKADSAEFTQWLATQYLPECTSHE